MGAKIDGVAKKIKAHNDEKADLIAAAAAAQAKHEAEVLEAQ